MASLAHWTPEAADFPDDPPPFPSRDAAGRPFLGFDDTTSESCVFHFKAPSGIDLGGNQTIAITWRAETATSGNVVWQAEVEAITPGDALNTRTTRSYASGQTVQDAAPGSAGNTAEAVITLSVAQADNIAAGDDVYIRISRLPASASPADDMANDAEILSVEWRDAA